MKHRVIPVNDKGYTIGENHHRAKITDAEVDLILELRDAGLSFAAIAAKWDDGTTISKSTVRDICNGTIRGQHPARLRRQ